MKPGDTVTTPTGRGGLLVELTEAKAIVRLVVRPQDGTTEPRPVVAEFIYDRREVREGGELSVARPSSRRILHPKGTCVVCGEPLSTGKRYCSRRCAARSQGLDKEARNTEIISLIREGRKSGEIAKKFGISRQRVSHIWKAAGNKPRERGRLKVA